MKENTISRRSFMVRAALLFGGAASIGGGYDLLGGKPRMKKVMYDPSKTNLMINPAFRSMKTDEGGLELFTFLTSGEKLSYTFSGIEAELLSAIKSRSHIKGLVPRLSQRYSISKEECMRKVKDSIDELNSIAVVLFKDHCNIILVENRYERAV